MMFSLPAEYQELQATVRKLAQEKVAPRAREIDTTAAYPDDLFEVFRDAGLLGLVIPEAYGGGGAGILGPTLAVEEITKYSNTDGRGRGADHEGRARGRGRRAARRFRALRAAGGERRRRDAHQGRARRRRLGAQRHEVLDVRRRAGRLVLRVRQDRARRFAQAR